MSGIIRGGIPISISVDYGCLDYNVTFGGVPQDDERQCFFVDIDGDNQG